MSLTSPIPAAAMPVVRVLRRDVKRPAELPSSARVSMYLRWSGTDDWAKMTVCPMGLHPKSHSPTPARNKDFADGHCRQQAVKAFYRWWDLQTDARAAVDALWPEEGK